MSGDENVRVLRDAGSSSDDLVAELELKEGSQKRQHSEMASGSQQGDDTDGQVRTVAESSEAVTGEVQGADAGSCQLDTVIESLTLRFHSASYPHFYAWSFDGIESPLSVENKDQVGVWSFVIQTQGVTMAFDDHTPLSMQFDSSQPLTAVLSQKSQKSLDGLTLRDISTLKMQWQLESSFSHLSTYFKTSAQGGGEGSEEAEAESEDLISHSSEGDTAEEDLISEEGTSKTPAPAVDAYTFLKNLDRLSFIGAVFTESQLKSEALFEAVTLVVNGEDLFTVSWDDFEKSATAIAAARQDATQKKPLMLSGDHYGERAGGGVENEKVKVLHESSVVFFAPIKELQQKIQQYGGCYHQGS